MDDAEGQKVNGGNKDQKTNNIGIIGVRGAGKTSILKTIRVQMEKSKRASNDIILPIIVPENMSESGTLMATVLGMLNEVIKERDEEEKKRLKKGNIDCIKKTVLRIKYDEVIKQYTYMLFQTVAHDEIRKKYEKNDHGCLYAISFLMNFYFSGSIYSLDDRKRCIVEMAAVSIYKHTNYYHKNSRMLFSRDPLSYFCGYVTTCRNGSAF